jgi:hypothetical protein
MISLLKKILNYYEIPYEDYLKADKYITGATEDPEKITLDDKSGGGSEETTLRQWVEDIIFREKLDKEESKMGVELEEIIA